MTKRLPLATILGVFVLLVLGGNTVLAGPPPAYFVDESKLPFDALPGTSTTRYWGVHGGAGYRIEVPDNWNGELVLYAHGFRGDNELFDYFLDFNLVAQALAGVQAQFPFPADYQTAVVPGVKAALGTPYPLALNAQGVKLRGVTQNISGGPRPAFATSFVFWGNFLFTVGVTGGDIGVAPGNVQDNSDTVYQIDSDPAPSADEIALNAAVLRVRQDPQGRHPNGLANIPPISGRLPIPVLSLHTIGDLFVPFSMEQIYARRAAAEGASGLLVTRAFRDHAHCGFDVLEEEAAFADLVNWVVNGVKPAGDDILNPAAVADPKFGCLFSVPGHAGFPACTP